jgi:hypothetical protein
MTSFSAHCKPKSRCETIFLEDVVKKKAALKNEKKEYLKTRYEILLTKR